MMAMKTSGSRGQMHVGAACVPTTGSPVSALLCTLGGAPRPRPACAGAVSVAFFAGMAPSSPPSTARVPARWI